MSHGTMQNTVSRRRNPDADPATRLRIYTEDPITGKWEPDAECTLGEFLAANESLPVGHDLFTRRLFMRGQYVGGGGAYARWKVAIVR